MTMTRFVPFRSGLSDVAILQNRLNSIFNDFGHPEANPDSLETNVPGIYVAGVVVGGLKTSDIFIENGRFHGRQIISAMTGKGKLPEPAPVAPPGE